MPYFRAWGAEASGALLRSAGSVQPTCTTLGRCESFGGLDLATEGVGDTPVRISRAVL
ncbi:MAG: hypothetical protein QOD87_1574, partial [Pseudonocardiales bacterium]|nr:hypothetical protein [Pseudonocardiales bacterium]